jgi:hypothetical protein
MFSRAGYPPAGKAAPAQAKAHSKAASDLRLEIRDPGLFFIGYPVRKHVLLFLFLREILSELFSDNINPSYQAY